VPLHEVPVEPVADPQRAFQVHPIADAPTAERGALQRLGYHVEIEP